MDSTPDLGPSSPAGPAPDAARSSPAARAPDAPPPAAPLDSALDVVGDILEAVHLTTAVFGRLELGAPWRLRIPGRPYLSFYVVARGSAWMEVGEARGSAWMEVGEARGGEQRGDRTGVHRLALSAGDAIVLPHGSPHQLRDTDRSDAPPHLFDYAACPRVAVGHAARIGGNGPATVLVTGQFTFGGSAARNPLLSTLPPVLHLPADAISGSAQLSGIVPLILAESAGPGPGATIVLARLADLLLIHALRHWISTTGAESCGLRAVADPQIGAALRLMHARPAEPWTVEALASAVAMSRSAFAARFTRLVGEAPLQYLARWRMTRAALLLGAGQLSVAAVAERVGYANPVAFTKAFTRLQGIGPGAYRRTQRVGARGTDSGT